MYTQKSTTPILALKLSVSAIITPGGLPHSVKTVLSTSPHIWIYGTASYFAKISKNSYRNRKSIEMTIFGLIFFKLFYVFFPEIYVYFLSISFIKTNIWDFCKINGTHIYLAG